MKQKLTQKLLYWGCSYRPFEDLDCIPHDLVIAKQTACRFDENMLCYIYLKIENSASVKNIKSSFEEMISGVPHG